MCARPVKDVVRELFQIIESKKSFTKDVVTVENMEAITDVRVPHLIKSEVVKGSKIALDPLWSAEEAITVLGFDEHKCRRLHDKVLKETEWVEWVTPMGNKEFFKAETNRNEEQISSLLMATGSSYRCFHQDLDPPLDAVNTVEAGRKLAFYSPRF